MKLITEEDKPLEEMTTLIKEITKDVEKMKFEWEKMSVAYQLRIDALEAEVRRLTDRGYFNG